MADASTPPSNDFLSQTLVQVMARVTEFLDVERSTLFLYDERTRELWTPVAQGSGEIRLPATQGIAGHVFTSGETVRLTDAYTDPRFQASVDRATGFRTRDIFCRPIQDSQGRRIGVIQLLNRRSGPMTSRDEALLDAICGQAGVAIENAQLFLTLTHTRDSEQRLHSELESKHTELQRAFLRIEEAATAQAVMGKHIQRVRLVTMITAVVLFFLVGCFAWLSSSGKGPAAGLVRSSATPVRWHKVETAPVRTGLALLGNIEPLEIRNLTAPLRGRIAEKNFQYGELVKKGQLLARIDTTDVAIDLRNTEAAVFKAQVELDRLLNWSKGPEVARAQRDLAKARLSYESNQRNLREMEQLSQLGIIAQGSLDSARQQFVNQEADFSAAREALENVMSTATEDRIRVARYDVENAQVRVDDLRAKIAAAVIYAPFDGIVILPNARPVVTRSNQDGFFEQGSTISQAEILLSLGNLEGVAVKARADEVDITRLRHEQNVIITGDAFGGHTLTGKVAYISSQAILTGPRPYFDILVKTGALSEVDLAAVRLGMTARVDITVYETAKALVVPVPAVHHQVDGSTIIYRRGANDQPQAVPVELGATVQDGVEVRTGLKAGDDIVANAKAVKS